MPFTVRIAGLGQLPRSKTIAARNSRQRSPNNEIDLTHSFDWRMPGIFGGVLRCSVKHKRRNRLFGAAAGSYYTCVSGWQHGTGYSRNDVSRNYK